MELQGHRPRPRPFPAPPLFGIQIPFARDKESTRRLDNLEPDAPNPLKSLDHANGNERDLYTSVGPTHFHEDTMTEHIQLLNQTDLDSIAGGDWQDVHQGFTYALSIGCYLSINPLVCAAALISHGFGIYAF